MEEPVRAGVVADLVSVAPVKAELHEIVAALTALKAEGLVETRTGWGTFVTAP